MWKALVSFADRPFSYARVFFSNAIDDRTRLLRHVKAIHHLLAAPQSLAAGGRIRSTHVRSVSLNLLTLCREQPIQAGLARSLIPALRQNPRLLGICQIRQDRVIQLMTLLEADFVHAHIGEALGPDRFVVHLSCDGP